jgi:hypothetical protein
VSVDNYYPTSIELRICKDWKNETRMERRDKGLKDEEEIKYVKSEVDTDRCTNSSSKGSNEVQGTSEATPEIKER